jgi:hypothetical protein
MWRALRPGESLSKGCPSKVNFSFMSTRTLAPGLTFHCFVSGSGPIIPRTNDESWSIRVTAAPEDDRVSALRTFVEDRDKSGLDVMAFDVLPAYGLLDGRGEPSPPSISYEAADDEIMSHLEEYSRKIDRIWDAFGGYSPGAFEALVTWAMVNREVVTGGTANMPMACAAFVYGDRALSLQFLAEYQSQWEESARSRPDDPLTQEIFAVVKEKIAKLRAIVEQIQQ